VTIIDAEMVSSMPANLKAATGGNPRDTKLEEIKSRYREIF
jgi:alcohol dehydrogenase class IV